MKTRTILTLLLFVASFSKAQTPFLHWALNAGSTSGDFGIAVKTDKQGNVYTLGIFQDKISFATATTPIVFTALGSADAFLTKHNSDGTLVWAKTWGGKYSDYPRAMTITDFGYIYIVGSYSGTSNFNPNGSKTYTSLGGTDIFISKFDTAGNFIWANGLGGSGIDEARGVACDNKDNLYVTGSFQNTVDFDLTVDEAIINAKGKSDIFLLKLNPGGNCTWVKQIGGYQSDSASSLALDKNNNIIITGNFADSADFDPDISTSNLYSKGIGDIFIAKYDSDGIYTWAKSMSGLKNDNGYSLVCDKSGNILCTGSFKDSLTLNSAGTKLYAKSIHENAFITKHDSAGNFVWAKQFNSTGSVINKCISLDNDENIFLTGNFNGKSDFDPSPDSFYLVATSYYYDIYVCKLNTKGDFEWAFGLGSSSTDNGNSITVSNLKSIFVTGAFYSSVDFDPMTSTKLLNSNGHDDVFIMKLENYSLGIEKLNSTNDPIKIFPNPTSGKVQIQMVEAIPYSVTIYNLMGSKISEQDFASTNCTIDISNQPNGIYLGKIRSEGTVIKTFELHKQ